jgi:hypothetical protein
MIAWTMPYSDPAAQREYQRQWCANRRAEWMAGKSCADCGSTTDLEVDHVDPSQKVSHRVWSWSRARRDAELAKCVVRCQPCHQRKTTRGQENGPRKVTAADVRLIRQAYAAGDVTQKALGQRFGLGQLAVSRIVRRVTWADVQ